MWQTSKRQDCGAGRGGVLGNCSRRDWSTVDLNLDNWGRGDANSEIEE